jgi:glycosyltransferase involved in cell wall biosynthesis
MKIAYVTSYNSKDLDAWSGLGFYIYQALERQGLDLVRIGPLASYLDPAILLHFVMDRARGLKFQRHRDPTVLKAYAREVSEQLKGHEVDILFSPGSLPLSYFKTDVPIVFWTDATFDGMVNFYSSMTRLSETSLRNGHEAEQSALTNCRMAIYSSDWAAQTALDHYEVDPAKIKVVPFGANLNSRRNETEIERLVARRKDLPFRLLFIGVEWERKGGDYAVALAENLVRHGVPVELTVVGCRVPRSSKRPFVVECGYLSKKKPKELAELERLLMEAHFLILPSRAECAPVVIAEANSFGVPIVGADTGGFPTLIKNGHTGFYFPLGTFVENATAEITRLRKDAPAYEKLALNAFRESDKRLNWDHAGQQVKTLLESIVERGALERLG